MASIERVRKYLEAGGVLAEVVRARTAELVRELSGTLDTVTDHVNDVRRRSTDLGRRTTTGVVASVTPGRARPAPSSAPEAGA
jgi:hypothetical protein